MKTSRAIYVLICISIVATFSISCSMIAKQVVEKPKVDLAHVAIKDADASGATVMFGLRVDNPNGFALKVDTLRYDIEIGGKQFSSGKIEKPAEVAAKSTSVVEIPVPLKYSEVFASLLDVFQKKTSTYRVKGDASFGLLSIPFDEKGEFNIRD